MYSISNFTPSQEELNNVSGMTLTGQSDFKHIVDNLWRKTRKNEYRQKKHENWNTCHNHSTTQGDFKESHLLS
jgi:hypothetical protein